MLLQEEILRYSRHFPVIGLEGQAALKKAKVLCIGAGGLGCPALQYLVSCGVGTIGIIDGDHVDLTNLHRQILFTEQDVGENKAVVAARKLHVLNPLCHITSYQEWLTATNITSLIESYQIVLDATDNYSTRYLINSKCRQLKIPLVSASIFQFKGQLSVYNFNDGPCYECLYPEPPPAGAMPNCAEAGVLGVLPGIAGTLQAAEVLKIILQRGDVLSGKLLSIDVLSMEFKTYKIKKNSHCSREQCSDHSLVTASPTCERLSTSVPMIDVAAFACCKNSADIVLLDVRLPYEREICHIGGLHFPLNELEKNLSQIPPDKKIIVYCKGGVRSAAATQLLIEHGFKNVYSLSGGILAWIQQQQPELMSY